MVPWDYDFSTLVQAAIPPYNPFKIQPYRRSLEGVHSVIALGAALGKINKLRGSLLRISDRFPRAGLRQLSERLHLPPAIGPFGSKAGFGLPRLQASDCLLRQHSNP